MPSVLFIYKNKNLADQFVKHFKLNGYDIHQFYDEEIPYYQFSKLQKLENIYHRVVKKDTQHIHKINHRNFINISKKKLTQLKKQNLKFDFCFVIRGDLVPENVLQYARTISDKMIDYQLDGLSVSSKILDYDKLFDKIYVFDEQDVKDYPEYNLTSITNCFFEEPNDEEIKWDFYYTGAGLSERIENLSNLVDYLDKNEYRFNLNLLADKDLMIKDKIKITRNSISYEENLILTKKSNILIDLKREEHDGLSLRFFEAMNFRKKIITDNVTAKEYDFYHPNNIYITDYINFEGLDHFLQLPYYDIDEQIVSKYRFDNWIKNVLEFAYNP